MNQTQLTRLMRIGWETVGNILQRVVAEKLPVGRLDGLALIGVDEVNYGADHKFLTCVANHETGGIVWATEGRNAASFRSSCFLPDRSAAASLTSSAVIRLCGRSGLAVRSFDFRSAFETRSR